MLDGVNGVASPIASSLAKPGLPAMPHPATGNRPRSCESALPKIAVHRLLFAHFLAFKTAEVIQVRLLDGSPRRVRAMAGQFSAASSFTHFTASSTEKTSVCALIP
jgi:hypothetical protein